MKKHLLEIFRCPHSGTVLNLKNAQIENGEVISGELVNSDVEIFIIQDGIPDLTWPKELLSLDESTRATYDKLANDYEKFANIPFETFDQSNEEVRELICRKLSLKPTNIVLEVGGGDGRGSEYILKYIPQGELYFQELSPAFLKLAIKRLAKDYENVNFSISNASWIPFPDNFFDAAHHFGGINTFSDKKKCLEELCRVVKPGGKIVIGDEGIGPWLRETEMAKIMINSNPLIGCEVPITSIPESARNVSVQWIMKGAFYIIDFEVGEGAPVANYNIKIPSERGGTHWSRYHGNLEGISDESKILAYKAMKKSGLSMSEWLDKVVKSSAIKLLEE